MPDRPVTPEQTNQRPGVFDCNGCGDRTCDGCMWWRVVGVLPRDLTAFVTDALEAAQKDLDYRLPMEDQNDLVSAEARVRQLEEAMRENVGDAYNLITQGESPLARRQPSARRIYDRSREVLAAKENTTP